MQYFDSSLIDEPFAHIGQRLRQDVEAIEPRLRRLTEADASRALAPGKWSAKQQLGHLIDSAANNHQRFVRGQETSFLRLPGYAQEHWVASQRHEARSWDDLIELWSAYNRHLAHVLAVIPEAKRDVPCEIGGPPTVTLSFLALDYVGHIHHHMRQIFRDPTA